MTEFIITLPDALAPISSNGLPAKHTKAFARMKHKFQTDATLLIKTQHRQQGYPELTPPVKVYVTYFFKENRRRDNSRFFGGTWEWLQDSIVQVIGIDDCYTQLRLQPMSMMVDGRGDPSTIVRIVGS